MSFAAAFGVEAIAGFAFMGPQAIPPTAKIAVQIGVGSTALGTPKGNSGNTGGITPSLFLYDAHGDRISELLGGDVMRAGTNVKVELDQDFQSAEGMKTPEYMRIQAHSKDATCISYVTVTTPGQDHRTWHAGYVKKCAETMGNTQFWYPSPESVPASDFKPGCIWLSNEESDNGLQGISFKLTDFGFPKSEEAENMQKQYTDFPDTLCQSPARMTLWKTLFVLDCIPFYDYLGKKNNRTTGPDAGFDEDFQRVIDGHTLPCKLEGGKLPGGSEAYKQTLEPGKGPKVLTPEQKIKQAADAKAKEAAENEAGINTHGGVPGAGNSGGTTSSIDKNEGGLNENAPNPGQGSSGGVVSEIGIPGAGAFGGVAGNFPVSEASPDGVLGPIPASPSGETPSVDESGGGIELSHLGDRKRSTPTRTRAQRHARRELLRSKRDHCVDRLVISYHHEHSAQEVCEMSTSWGPDFVSMAEGLYCDMCEREIWKICDEETSSNCFDLQIRVLVRDWDSLENSKAMEVFDLKKSFVLVEEWEI